MASKTNKPEFELTPGIMVGGNHPPLVIAEIGINHEGSFERAVEMVDAAIRARCRCIKFQCHVIEDEMIPNNVIPGNASESIWDIMKRCALTLEEEIALKKYVERQGAMYLSTPFSRAAADRLEKMGVTAYKIGSGECNNYPLIKHIAQFGKPIILSTGMNNLPSIRHAVDILRGYNVPYALLQCTSMYPTPLSKVNLEAVKQLSDEFTDAVVGLSDHSTSLYPSYGAVALGARIIEKHFTSSEDYDGPDIPISVNPSELQELIHGCSDVWQAMNPIGGKNVLPEEQPTIDFAYACVVSIRDIKKGEKFTTENIWVKRPGTGEIKAAKFDSILGLTAMQDIPVNTQLKNDDIKN